MKRDIRDQSNIRPEIRDCSVPWARHGSTRWLWKPQHVWAAIQYVVAEQGDAMSAFESDES